ncbi:uncharacterized protein LOC130509928 [Raphanus sativus]|uniref:Uncharacterized protein LOC130509928 n=1 Tax=Raphanus sativus TaxID=3726 RepID=A0A9W3DEF4_RAPSA|nr:uncharacterized protein LOC130509928 [Raphanus sativus]
MDANLVEVMQGMSLEEDKPIVIPEDITYCAMERGGRSLLGRFLNPECQHMPRMLKTMPKIWKVYERARGIALSKERFQFVFDLETDIQTVLKQGFWTFDDWGMALERWVEVPPRTYLQTAAIWVRLRNIPVNYLTYKTIDAIADGIGHVEVIEFDPEKPQLQDYVRVQVTIDLNLPVRDKKSLSLPGGRVEYIDVEYERVRKKCYHCMRLTHEKLKCPLFQGNKSKGKEIAVVQSTVQNQSGGSRQHHNDLTEKIMPLLAPSVPPGFAPQSTLVAPEVFEEMRFYMNCIVPEERRVREAKMRKTLDELSRDPVAQRSCLRLERAPLISRERTGEVGHVFDFCTSENGGVPDVVESSLRRAPHQYDNRGMERDGSRLHEEGSGTVGATGEPDTVGREVVLASPQKKRLDTRKMNEVNAATSSALEQPRFTMGYTPAMSADKSSKSRGTTRSKSSWCRRDQKKRRATGPDDEGVFRESEEGPLKRKATDEDEVSSKVSKQHGGLMVHQKPSNPQ